MLDHNDFSIAGGRTETDGRSIVAEMTQKFQREDRPQGAGEHETLFSGIGRLICAWGQLEVQLERKIADLRRDMGDARSASARTKPSMGKMFSELRAIISMRCRRDNVQLVEIAEIERVIQQIDKFRMLVIHGFQAPDEQGGTNGPAFLCRDAKNNMVSITLRELNGEILRLDACRARLLAL